MARADEPAGSSAETVLITRYPNRRLYDRSQARYVTLPEIAELVQAGRTVAVRDSKTGEDLTRSILTQIILEHYPERMELFPVNVLSSIIRSNESVLGFLRDYLQQSLTYLDVLQRPAAANPLLLPLNWMRSILPSSSQGPAAPAADADSTALLRRIADLEQRLDALQPGDATRAPTTPAEQGKRRRSSKPS